MPPAGGIPCSSGVTMLKSLRWRLPFSFGAISLLAAVSLGAVLLLTLRGYYAREEQRLLEANAAVVADTAAGVLRGEMRAGDTDWVPFLTAYLEGSAYLTRVRFDLYGADGVLLASSGDPQALAAVTTLSLEVETPAGRQSIARTVSGEGSQGDVTTIVVVEADGRGIESERSVGGQDVSGPVAQLQRPYAGLLAPPDTAQPADGSRSALVVRYPILDFDGAPLGTLVLHDGPALGRAVVGDVAAALLLAGSVAVLLATAVGALVSRGLSRPLLRLTAATERMAAGDLGARAGVNGRHDEIGALGTAFNQMATQVEATVETLRRFVADAAHELNTPLTALRTELELARRRDPESNHLAAAAVQTDRLQQLGEDLLALSRLEGAAASPPAVMVDLAELLDARAETYAALGEQAGVTLVFEVPAARALVRGHAGYLLRAIDNLVDNGVKFSATGGMVTLRLRAAAGWAEVVVVDTGIGIAAGELAHVQRRFFRGSNAAAYPGSGLGLAIVASVAARHGGTLSLASKPAGTTATLRLPLA